MRVLLDTHAFIWWVNEPAKLTQTASALIGDPDNQTLLSAVTAWELTVKHRKGRLDLPDSPENIFRSAFTEDGFAPLPIDISHALQVSHLPPIHNDPFDRLLIAQAQVERIPILTSDPNFARYEVEVIW